jgi:hypothetical protein
VHAARSLVVSVKQLLLRTLEVYKNWQMALQCKPNRFSTAAQPGTESCQARLVGLILDEDQHHTILHVSTGVRGDMSTSHIGFIFLTCRMHLQQLQHTWLSFSVSSLRTAARK